MASHRTVTLQLRQDKPDNVYRFVYDWQPVPSSHDDSAFYLLLHALVQWGPERDYPVEVFSIAMQYSRTPGENVDVSQPAHITQEDAEAVAKELTDFINRRKGKK